MSCGDLLARVVNGIVSAEKNLRDWDYAVAVCDKGFDYAGQSFGGVFGGVMEEDYAAGFNVFKYPLLNITRGDAFPVKAVNVPLYGGHAHAVHGFYNMVIIFAVGTAEEAGAYPGDSRYLFVAGA